MVDVVPDLTEQRSVSNSWILEMGAKLKISTISELSPDLLQISDLPDKSRILEKLQKSTDFLFFGIGYLPTGRQGALNCG